MFCYQCEQSKAGNCHSSMGVCGKDDYTSAAQDVLIYATKGLAFVAEELKKLNFSDKKYDLFIVESLFTTITNVNFDSDNIIKIIEKADQYLKEAKAILLTQGGSLTDAPEFVDFDFSKIRSNMDAFVDEFGVEARHEKNGRLITGLEELVVYGLKGAAAYMDHAHILGYENEQISADFNSILSYVTKPHTAGELLGKALETGKLNYEVMELLSTANTTTYGHPVPTKVNINVRKNKAILISGHDLKDLELLLKQTEGMGIDIYTHSEMLPAHGYPELKKYSHLYGNFGGAWQNQTKEFDAFPGAILMTTNCIQRPRKSYEDRIFTTGLVEFPNVVHITDKDFSPVIKKALEMPGFTEDTPEQTILTGFGHNAVLSVAPQIIDAVKSGAISHFYLIGGCDGAKPGRNYYTELAQKIPQDAVILTLACGKYRFNKLEFGDIGGIPRLLDVGQCNDSYSAIQIALALADAFQTDVNSLPLSIILSWYEQKAVSVLLTLLYLGIKNIKIGPSLPQFLEPEAVQILVDTFGLAPISTPEEDM
jgi:hydroxylamine reductase